jgi:hypothetical protein
VTPIEARRKMVRRKVGKGMSRLVRRRKASRGVVRRAD